MGRALLNCFLLELYLPKWAPVILKIMMRLKMKLLVAAAVSLFFAGILGGSARAWDYVWGDPGPLNYSAYQDGLLTNDGSTVTVGFFSGSFFGLESPEQYARFVQLIGSDGDVKWTKFLLPDRYTSFPSTPEIVIDGDNTIFVAVENYLSWISEDAESGDLRFVGSMKLGANKRTIAAFDSGGVVVIKDDREVTRYDALLESMWTRSLDPNVVNCGTKCEVIVAPDDSVWVIGTRIAPLPTLNDALVMIHISSDGQLVDTVRYYDYAPYEKSYWASAILGVTDQAIWIRTQRGTWIFSVVNGERIAQSLIYDGNAIDLENIDGGEFTVCTPEYGAPGLLGMNGSRLITIDRCEGGSQERYVLVDRLVRDLSGSKQTVVSYRPLKLEISDSSSDSGNLFAFSLAANEFGESILIGTSTTGEVFERSVVVTGNARLGKFLVNAKAMAVRNPLGSLYFGLRSPRTRTEVLVAGRNGVPVGAKSVSLSVTATAPKAGGSLTVWPCDRPRPVASSVTYTVKKNATNTVVSSLSDDGKVCVYNTAATHLIVDVIGRGSDDSDYVALQPARLLDTLKPGKTVDRISAGIGRRTASSVTELKVAGRGRVGAEADAVALNVSALVPSGNGFVTIYPCGSKRPAQESVSYSLWQSTTNMVVSKVGTGGKVCLYTSASTDLQVDAIGYVDSGSTFKSLSPARLLDSRADSTRTTDGKYWKIGRRAANSVTQLEVSGRGRVASGASTVVLNVAAISPKGAGSLKVYQCGIKTPNAISVSYSAGATTRTTVLTRVGAGGKVCIKTSQALDISVDVVAYSDANSSFQALRPARVVNTAVK
jgi:hypothetical protein